ncbi:hypothetical protein [Commensalibacter intestini]|uniref:hypothetical protein n=1 Tax=Commensalibacter intestini TaxID=479936 RepID=UPI000A37A833|nr:hypothetical protein [Commensalibacter intestini]
MSKAFNRFAHLVGLRARAEEPDPNDPTAENNDPDNNAGDDGQDPDDPDPDAEDGDDETDAEDGDDETDAEDEDDDTTAQARARERGRCAAIFGCKEAANNLPLAAELAFGTNMPRSQAIRVLKSGSIAQSNSTGRSSKVSAYDQKMMRSRQTVSIGKPQTNQHLNPIKAAAASILNAGKVTGSVKKDIQL